MSIIFTHDQEQHKVALASKKDHEELSGSKIYTEIKPFEQFYLAEDYHQKYYLQGDRVLFREIQAYYKIFSELVGSTVAARLNGYVAGYGDPALIREEIMDYGLSPEGQRFFSNYQK
jgi:peptide-methionine (S)-S-oxide reductase